MLPPFLLAMAASLSSNVSTVDRLGNLLRCARVPFITSLIVLSLRVSYEPEM